MTTPSTESAPSTESTTPPADSATTQTDSTSEAPAAEGKEPKVYDEATVKGLRQESAGYRTRLRDTETTLTATQAELATARETLPTLESRASQAEALATKYRVALDAGLPRNLAERLVGADEESLKADAESLKALIGANAPVLDLDQGNRTSPPAKKASISEALRVLARPE